MADRRQRIEKVAAICSPLCLGQVLLLIMFYLANQIGVLPEYLVIVSPLLIFGAAVTGGVVLFSWANMIESEAPNGALAFKRPGQEPGRRTWRHDVFDENAYAILGVPQNATRAQIRDAFKKLAQKHHPDALPPEEKERASLIFFQLDKAYELLTHTKNRARYDAWIEYLGGQEPMLDTVLEAFKNSASLAEFDAALARGTLAAPESPPQAVTESEPHSQDENRNPTAAQIDPHPSSSQQPQPEAAQSAANGTAPPEVEIPDAVREALGLPAADQPGK